MDKNICEPLDYNRLMKTLTEFSEAFPTAGITYVGTSVLGRGIPMITLGEGTRSVLYVGGHHGMEWLTGVVLLRFAAEYCEALSGGRRCCSVNVQTLFRRRVIHIIPILNVDGADLQINGAEGCILKDRLVRMNGGEDFSHWQSNARGVDLNHNYDAGFYEYKKIEEGLGIDGGAATRFSGESPESEPETAALCSFLRFNRDIRAVLTLHTQGEEIYCGSGARLPGCMTMARVISRMTGYELKTPDGPAAYGGLTDWVTGELRRPSFTLECGKGENPLPITDADGIYCRLRELLFSFPILA